MRSRRAVDALVIAWAATVLVSAQQTRDTAGPPDAASLVLTEARALIDAGKPAAAIEKLRAHGESADPRVAELLGVAYYHANDAAHAIDTLQPVLTRLPSGSAERREAVQVLGLSHYLAGHIAESIPYLEEIRAAVPETSSSRTRSAWRTHRRVSPARPASRSRARSRCRPNPPPRTC